MITSLRARILVITTATVVGALVISGGATYAIVRANTMETISHQLGIIADGSVPSIGKWASAKAPAAIAAADAGGGAAAATALSADFEATAKPWYQAGDGGVHVSVANPYREGTTGVSYVSFNAPIMRDGVESGLSSVSVPLDGVREIVSAVHPTPSSLAFVVAASGQLLAHRDAAMMLKPVATLASALAPQMLTALARAASPRRVVFRDGTVKFLKAESVPGTDWYLVLALTRPSRASRSIASSIPSLRHQNSALVGARAGASSMLNEHARNLSSMVRLFELPSTRPRSPVVSSAHEQGGVVHVSERHCVPQQI